MDPNSSNTLLERITNTNVIGSISPAIFLINILISLLLSLGLAYIYSRYGRSISNRKEFSSIFPILTMTTMFIISIVKSSLALSLGLVGALSIVRFRSAIKEPEELVFIFLAMAVGLGLGANQVLLSFISTAVIASFIVIRGKKKFAKSSTHISLMISYPFKEISEFEKVIDVIKENCESVNLRRYTENNKVIESVLVLDITSFQKIIYLQKVLSSMFPGIEIDYVDGSFI